jgi:hypothetical protein
MTEDGEAEGIGGLELRKRGLIQYHEQQCTRTQLKRRKKRIKESSTEEDNSLTPAFKRVQCPSLAGKMQTLMRKP